RTVELDEGWSHDRDVSILAGRWAWLDVRALVEDHAGGKILLRVSTHLRPTSFGIVGAFTLAAALLTGASAGIALRWPLGGITAAVVAVVLAAYGVWRTAQSTAILHRGVRSVTADSGMVAIKSGLPRVVMTPSVLRMYGLRSAVVF